MSNEQVIKAGSTFSVSNEIHDVVIEQFRRIEANMQAISDLAALNKNIKEQAFDTLREAVPEAKGWVFSYDHENKQVVLMYRED